MYIEEKIGYKEQIHTSSSNIDVTYLQYYLSKIVARRSFQIHQHKLERRN